MFTYHHIQLAKILRIFISILMRKLVSSFLLFIMSLSDSNIRVILDPYNESISSSSILYNWYYLFSLNVWKKSPVKPSMTGVFFGRRFFTTNSISLTDTELFSYSVSMWVNLGNPSLSRKLSISSKLLNLLEKVFHNIMLFSFNICSICSIISSFSFPILAMCVFSHCFPYHSG